MNLPKQLAQHFREVHSGGNWTASNLRDQLSDITWQEATTKIDSLNSIVALVYHINYYVGAVMGVLQGQPLTSKDKYSFDHPPVASQEDWEKLVNKTLADAENLTALIEKLPDSKFEEIFVEEKYGTYHRNILGLIEHTHYHLGQIAVIKKMIKTID